MNVNNLMELIFESSVKSLE